MSAINCAGVFLFMVVLSTTSAFAGDAVVIGYNADGVWTAVTYYCSSTRKGGNDYKDKLKAREEALRDLKRRAGEQMVGSSVLAEIRSDRVRRRRSRQNRT